MPTTSHSLRFSALFSLLLLLSFTLQTAGCGSSPAEPEGRTCSSHHDCPDGLCLDRECTDEAPAGDKAYLEICSIHEECESGFCDQNCDGIHGTRSAAYFVSPIGDDNNTGTTDAPH